MVVSSLVGLVLLGPALALAFSPSGIASELPPPLPIVGGTDAATCEFPATVMMLEDDETPVMCSGSLIAPDIVLTAAHCLIPERPIVAIGFGEAGQVFGIPAFTVAPTQCEAHPDWANQGHTDVAYCRLAEPVTTVPIVPLLGGCEVDALQPGVELTIVGFGATWGSYDEENDMVISMGVGAKRWTTQIIDSVDLFTNEVNMVGANGSQSACFGDSGGPALVELGDGTWRVVGAGSHLFDPGGFPGPMEKGNICGVGVAYSFAPGAIDWLESETGVDLVPCWDGDEWVAGCGDFPMDPNIAAGAWKNGCAGGPLGGFDEPTCEPVVSDETGSEESTGDPTGEPTTGNDDGETTAADDGTTSIDPSTSSSTTSASTTSSTSTSTSATATGAVADDSGGTDTSGTGEDTEGGGCGCRSAQDRGQPWWAVALLALLGGRSRRIRR
jgi:MYXO-CTERM domain-containing protein